MGLKCGSRAPPETVKDEESWAPAPNLRDQNLHFNKCTNDLNGHSSLRSNDVENTGNVSL